MNCPERIEGRWAKVVGGKERNGYHGFCRIPKRRSTGIYFSVLFNAPRFYSELYAGYCLPTYITYIKLHRKNDSQCRCVGCVGHFLTLPLEEKNSEEKTVVGWRGVKV
jgi:hypothetical protein